MESGESVDRKLVRLAATQEDDMDVEYSTLAYFKTKNDQVVFIMNKIGRNEIICMRILSQDQITELTREESDKELV